MEIKHEFHLAKTNSDNLEIVRPIDWNKAHKITTAAAGVVLGRSSGTPGDVSELPFAIEADGRVEMFGTQGVTFPKGTTAERPTAGRPGEIRWNTSTNSYEVFDLNDSNTWTAILAPPAANTNFAAYMSPVSQTVLPGLTEVSAAKVNFAQEFYDQPSCWDAPNARFLCRVPYEGYWHFNVSVAFNVAPTVAPFQMILTPYKNNAFGGVTAAVGFPTALMAFAFVTMQYDVQLLDGDFVDFRVAHAHPESLGIAAGAGSTHIRGYRTSFL